MNYAELHCTYREEINPHRYIFTGKCVVTGDTVTVSVRAAELFTYRQGAPIQVALRSNTATEREFLMSGLSEAGWNEVFP